MQSHPSWSAHLALSCVPRVTPETSWYYFSVSSKASLKTTDRCMCAPIILGK